MSTGEPTVPSPTTDESFTAEYDSPNRRHEATALLTVARDLAPELRDGAQKRDQSRQFPYDEIDRLRGSGLLAAVVPERDGGSGLAYSDHLRIVQILAAGDPNLAQMYHGHGIAVLIAGMLAEPELRRSFNRRVSTGSLFWANAYSERRTRDALTFSVTADPRGDEWVLNGTKYYCTGSLGADELFVSALDTSDTAAEDTALLVFVPTDSAGVTIRDDWDGMGQRTTASGTVEFHDVHVDANRVGGHGAVYHAEASPRTPITQSGFTAVFLGIAEDALRDCLAYLNESARPYPFSGHDRAIEDPYVLGHLGEMRCRLDAAQLMFNRTLELIDRCVAEPTERSRGLAAIAMAQSKALATEAVLEICQILFQVCGASATRERYGFDRHWRNARTLTLHDPVDYKFRAIGEFAGTGKFPEVTAYT